MKWLFFLLNILLLLSNGYSKNEKPKRFGRGSLFHEVARLPYHFFMLNHMKFPNLQIDTVFYGTHSRQYYLVCQSKNAKPHQAKAIFYVHGGGWHLGKPEHHLKFAEIFTEKGFYVILPAYRLSQTASASDMFNDVYTAYNHASLLLNREDQCVNGMILGGVSAGGNLSALLFVSDTEKQLPIKGYFSLAGALDIRELKQSMALKKYAGKPNTTTYDFANPVSYIKDKSEELLQQIPILCVHGTKDGMVPPCASQNFTDAICKSSCNNIQLVWFDATHLELSSQWYYKPEKNLGQKEYLITWIMCIS